MLLSTTSLKRRLKPLNGPLLWLLLAIGFPIWIALSLSWIFAAFATAIALAILRAGLGDEASKQHDALLDKVFWIAPAILVAAFWYAKLDELTNHWQWSEFPRWTQMYFFYLAIVTAAAAVYAAIWIAGAAVLERFPIVQYILAGLLVLGIAANLFTGAGRDCDQEVGLTGLTCD